MINSDFRLDLSLLWNMRLLTVHDRGKVPLRAFRIIDPLILF